MSRNYIGLNVPQAIHHVFQLSSLPCFLFFVFVSSLFFFSFFHRFLFLFLPLSFFKNLNHIKENCVLASTC